jgi:predicted amidohydrolase
MDGAPSERASLRAAAVQMCSSEDVPANLERASALVQEASRQGAELVGLPENFAYLGSDKDHKTSIAETLDAPGGAAADGPILERMRRLAIDTSVWLLLGGFPERVPGQEARLANTSVLLDPRGELRARYRKIHLFDVEVPGGQRFCESDTVVRGDGPVLADTPWGPLGLSICYDLRFPELYRGLTAQGARMIAVPAAFTRETGKDHWHVLLRARAIENQAYVIAPAQWGFHGGRAGGSKRASYGHAVIVDPWGVVLAECGERDSVAVATIDFEYQDRVRANLPALAHRRL